MADEGHDAMLAQFQDVTGLEDADRASFYLESAGWNLEIALGSFYEGNEEVAMDEGQPPAPAAAAATDDATPAAAAARAPTSGGGVGSNVRTVAPAAHQGSDSESSEEEGQAFYAGGSSTSGQQILGPPKKKGEAFVKDLFKKAREAGAEAVDPSGVGAAGRSASQAFTGTGFKLGSTESSSEKVAGREIPKPPRQFVLKMWRDGFSIDDGDLRPYNDPQNRAFLAAVMSGRIPNELVSMAEGGEVHVDMEDHKEEEFVKPKGARKAFTGSGHVLGGIAPTVVSEAATAAAPPDPNAEKKAQDGLELNPEAPSTSIQIRLPDGKRLVAKVNHGHTVGDLRRFVSSARPDVVPFSLHATYPPKELSDDGISVEAAGLVGAAILLRRK